MKLLIISTVPYEFNGISTVIQNLYANEVFSKENLTFLFPIGSDSNRINVLEHFGYTVILNGDRSKNTGRYIRFLITLIKKEQFNIVHVHGSSATNFIEILATYCAKTPIRIMHCHSSKNKYAFIHKAFKPFLNLLCTHRFACSHEAGKFLFGKAKCEIINNAFDVSKYQFDNNLRIKYRKELNINNNATVIGHVGVMGDSKNQTFLVKAFSVYHKNNNNSILLLVGDGNNRSLIEKEILDMGLQDSVKLIGSCNYVSEILNAMDCFVFPSLHEGLGIAPIEAQANGLPVISACDNIPSLIKINDNFCFMSLSEGENAWAEKMETISKVRDARVIENVCNAGYDLSKEIKKLHTKYTELLSKV